MKKSSFRFNVVDVLIVAVVIAAIALGAFLLTGRSSDSFLINNSKNAITKQFTYNVLLREASPEFISAVKKNVDIFEGAKSRNIGTISDISTEKSIRYEFNQITGEYVETEIPDKYDVILTISAEGDYNKLVYHIEEYEIHIGKSIDFTGVGFVGHGVVVDIGEVE